jgi:hypothetical protein
LSKRAHRVSPCKNTLQLALLVNDQDRSHTALTDTLAGYAGPWRFREYLELLALDDVLNFSVGHGHPLIRIASLSALYTIARGFAVLRTGGAVSLLFEISLANAPRRQSRARAALPPAVIPAIWGAAIVLVVKLILAAPIV